MGLADIAAGVEVTAEQRNRGVATVDRTDDSLAERLAPYGEHCPVTLTRQRAWSSSTWAGGAWGLRRAQRERRQ